MSWKMGKLSTDFVELIVYRMKNIEQLMSVLRRRHRSLLGKTHRHCLPSQRRNHQWSMVVSDDSAKTTSCRHHVGSNVGGGGAPKTNDVAGLFQSGHADDGDWTSAGRRLLLPADDTIDSPVKFGACFC